MNASEATAYVNDLVNLSERERGGLVALLVAGTLTVCHGCQFTMLPGTVCEICDAAWWEGYAAKHDAEQADRDWLTDRQTFHSHTADYSHMAEAA